MDLNKQLAKGKHYAAFAPREEKLRETVEKSRELYFRLEQQRLMTRWEFLWSQLRFTRKRWWGLQALLLLLACQILPEIEDSFTRVRSVSVIGCLFVVFMLPELWRNKGSNSMQVEAGCLYSLRQIYAARIILFGIVDALLLTVFAVELQCRLGLTVPEVAAQLILPVTVTAGICFWTLCGSREGSEIVPLAISLLWSGGWWLVLMREEFYARIFPVAWTGLLGLSVLFLALAIRRVLRKTNQYWEVEFA